MDDEVDLFERPVRDHIEGFSDEQKTVWDHRGGFIEPSGGADTKPRLERWRAEQVQELFVLYRSDGQVWNTDCRKWALISLIADAQSGLGYVHDDGGVHLDDARITLPAPVAWYTVAGGGGVCSGVPGYGRDYPASKFWKPVVACVNWIESVDTADRGRRYRTAKERYELLLTRQKKSQINMMKR